MTAATFCSSGQAERVKGSVHAVAGAVVGVMAIYNAVAWWYRRERHLGVNAVLYAAGCAFEAYQTSRHVRHWREPHLHLVEQRVADCDCGDGFCWCGSAEASVLRREIA